LRELKEEGPPRLKALRLHFRMKVRSTKDKYARKGRKVFQ